MPLLESQNQPLKPAAPPRLLQLDTLRGVAILLVLGNHAPVPPQAAGCFEPFAAAWQRFGWVGVDLFFVLSGFLIGGLLFKELQTRAHLDLRRFLIRRCFKIWPSYYLCVCAGLLLTLVRTHGKMGTSLLIMWPNFVHIQNYCMGERPILHTWSLAVEEHFYLALPFCLWLLTRKHLKDKMRLSALPLLAGSVMLFSLTFRCLVNSRHPFNPYTHIFYTHIRIDSLMFGVLLAYWHHFDPGKLEKVARQRLLLLAISLMLISPALFFDRNVTPFIWTVGYTLIYLGFGGILLVMIYTPLGEGWSGRCLSGKSARLLAWIGVSSYTIYLWHGLFALRPIESLDNLWLIHLPWLRWSLGTGLYLALAIGVGTLAGILVDKRVLRLRDRLFPARANALTLHPQLLEADRRI